MVWITSVKLFYQLNASFFNNTEIVIRAMKLLCLSPAISCEMYELEALTKKKTHFFLAYQ